MLFLFGGIPDLFVDKFKAAAIKRLKDHDFTFLPLRDVSGRFLVDEDYCANLSKTLFKYLRGRSNSAESGTAVVMLLPEWLQANFAGSFSPFALYREARFQDPFVRTGPTAAKAGNDITDLAIGTALRLARPARALKGELSGRLRRTPLLLPLEHFSSERLVELISDVGAGIAEAPDADSFIRDRCAQFERHHPFKKGDGGRGHFTGSRDIDFLSPGRALHAKKGERLTEHHTEFCFLNAKLRLGAPIQEGFHYDCTRRGAGYSGEFRDCHGEIGSYAGNPHLNVYPNGFIRT